MMRRVNVRLDYPIISNLITFMTDLLKDDASNSSSNIEMANRVLSTVQSLAPRNVSIMSCADCFDLN